MCSIFEGVRVPDPVQLVLGADSRPRRMVWESRTYAVLDTPTRLKSLDGLRSMVRGAAPGATGWRFTARAEEGDAQVFDVAFNQLISQWELVRCYD